MSKAAAVPSEEIGFSQSASAYAASPNGREDNRGKQVPTQLQRLSHKLTQVDERLQDAKTLTDTKFNQLNEQMNVI